MKKLKNTDRPLFLQIKEKIYEQILDGRFSPGEKIPTEAKWAKDFAVSRVTVRKALDELKKEAVISSVQGQGTIVTFDQNVSKGTLETIAVVAGANDQFVGSFLEALDLNATEKDALVVFKSDPLLKADDASNTFKTLYKRKIRNCVLWPNNGFDDEDLLYRLRLLGMNLVFFDHSYDSTYADSVTLDNEDAISSLYSEAKNRGSKTVAFLGWNNVPLSSTKERIESFSSLDGNKNLHLFGKGPQLDSEISTFLKNADKLPDAFICGNGDLAVSLRRSLGELSNDAPLILSVDSFPKTYFPEIVCYEQPLNKMAEKVFECLVNQNDEKVKWKSQTYKICGRII